MIRTVDGEIYHISSGNRDEARSLAKEFFGSGEHENDVLAVSVSGEPMIYISCSDEANGMIDENAYVRFTENVFAEARENLHLLKGGVIPALNAAGDPVCLLKLIPTKGYFHRAGLISEPPDGRVFDLYHTVVLTDVTEYAFLLLRDVLKGYRGRILCVGKEWEDFFPFFHDRGNLEQVDRMEDIPAEVLLDRGKTMVLKEFNSATAGTGERCENGLFSYDEIMTIVYFFSVKQSCGEKYGDKKFFLLDPIFVNEGLMCICERCETPYAYAKANGFIPVLTLTRSDRSFYSDEKGEDIWAKFFVQPEGTQAEEWREAKNVYMLPPSTISNAACWLMTRIAKINKVSLACTDHINPRVRKEIDEARSTVLKDPQKTIGVLIRGTDYTTHHLKGHSVMASCEQVMEKVEELKEKYGLEFVYLSTEDADVLEKMKELCGDKLLYIDQKRFRVRPGEMLSDLKPERENEGWLKGKEYLTTLKLLSECAVFVASGGCCGTDCALTSGKEHFKEAYVFDLGIM